MDEVVKMKIIETYKDVIELKNNGYNEAILNVIEDKIKEIYINLTEDKTLSEIEEFKLDDVGKMIIIEEVDDKNKVEEIIGEELIVIYPEYINEINIFDNETIYEALILCNNEYGIQIFIPNKIAIEDEDIQNWIDENK